MIRRSRLLIALAVLAVVVVLVSAAILVLGTGRRTSTCGDAPACALPLSASTAAATGPRSQFTTRKEHREQAHAVRLAVAHARSSDVVTAVRSPPAHNSRTAADIAESPCRND
jgi:hypothetical protein